MFGKVYRDYMVSFRLMIWLCSAVEDEIEHRVYGEFWVTSLVIVRFQVQEPS